MSERKLSNIRLSDEEKALLLRAATAVDLPLATYIRKVALAEARKVLLAVKEGREVK